MTCLGWKPMTGCREAPTGPTGCPSISWFYWLLAGAAAYALLVPKKRNTRSRK